MRAAGAAFKAQLFFLVNATAMERDPAVPRPAPVISDFLLEKDRLLPT